jgi:2-haloacid dehalogenase
MSELKVYVFDAYGTLFDVHSAVARHREAIGPNADRLSEIWRIKQLEYSWVRSLMHRYRDFWELTEQALDFAINRCGGIETVLRAQLLDAYRTLDAYPEVPAVLKKLKERGARLAILSNGTPAMLDSAVKSADLGDIFDAILSVQEVGIFKPDPRVYQGVLDQFEVTISEVSFQSSNGWDVAGAAAFGFRTVWINRTGQPREYDDVGIAGEATDLRILLEKGHG